MSWLAWLLISLFGMLPAGDETASDIIEKAEQLMRGKTMQGVYEMQVVHPDWQRSVRFEFFSEGKNKAFIHILEPARERGIKFLKIDNEMWQYIPRVNRVIKIPPSMMMQSWMGSDFTNDDLVKESSIATDYTHKLLGDEQIDGFDAYKIELTPRPKAAVVWGGVIEWVRKSDYVPLRADFYNERGERVRTLTYSEIKKMDDRVIPTRMELTLEKEPGNRTILLLEQVEFNKPIPNRVFTQQNLRRR